MTKKHEHQDGPLTHDDKLDLIVEYLRRMDVRDRRRQIAGFFRGLLALIPTALFLWSIWYLYQHGDDLLKELTKQAAEQARIVTEQQGSGFMEQLKKQFGQP